MVRRKDNTPAKKNERRVSSPDKNTSRKANKSKISKLNLSKRKKQPTSTITIGGKPFKVNLKLLRLISKLQATVDLLVPKLSLARVVREVLQDQCGGYDLRITVDALRAIHEAVEHYLVQIFEDSNLLTMHRRAITLMPKDMQLISLLREKYNVA